MIAATPELLEIIGTLPPIALVELEEEAAFLIRRDRKYLVPDSAVTALLARLGVGTRVLEVDGRRSFGYRTPYFDDATLASYLGAARRRPKRFKVRTRLYIDSALCQFEVKIRDGRGCTVKRRAAHDVIMIDQLTDAERAWLHTFPQVAPYASCLRHCMTTEYRRITFMLPDGAGRVTVDRHLAFALPDGKQLAVPSYAIIETKGPGRATVFDRVLWRSGYRPVPFSKFAVGISLLKPGLPANRWYRLRQRLASAIEHSQPLSENEISSNAASGVLMLSSPAT